MLWYVTNYEYLRNKPKAEALGRLAGGPNTLLALDESAAIRNKSSAQFQVTLNLRKQCARVWLLNGTPIAQSPKDMFAQGVMMDPRILGCTTQVDFMARYAVMNNDGFKAGGRRVYDKVTKQYKQVGGVPTQVLKWVNLDDLQKRFAPYTLRRLKKDCLDLPEKMPPATIAVSLSQDTWRVYQDMKKDALAWLDANSAAVALQAGIKVMRLAQITSGFLGGIQYEAGCERCDQCYQQLEQGELWEETVPCTCTLGNDLPKLREVGREKLDFILEWLRARLVEKPTFKAVIWCRFRPELERLINECQALGTYQVVALYGGQKREERLRVLKLLHPASAPAGPVVCLGVDGVGATGVSMAALESVVHVSHGNSLFHRVQSDERPHRAGQVNRVAYTDVVAVGPKGQHTIDHVLVKALRAREELASWTCSAWVKALRSLP